MQRVDLIVDGKLKNTSQKSDLPAFQKRVTAAYQTAGETIVRRSGVPHTPPVVSFTPVMFTAQNPLAVLDHPWPGRVALSADHAFRAAVEAAIPILRARGFELWAWCDSRPAPDGTPPEEAIALAKRHGLAGVVLQAESVAEADLSIAAIKANT